jgi:beta-1,4-mannosyl-glycoprotein beta-1,4-N-acetylglucosaminyltransferase
MYFDEDLMVELRLNILDKYVDKFVIVEATRDHSGRKKKLNFNIKKFKQFENKIVYLVVDDIPEKVNNYKKGWSPNFFRENFNRNAISRALTECSPDDLIIISDADEIPNLEFLNSINIKFVIQSQLEWIFNLL